MSKKTETGSDNIEQGVVTTAEAEHERQQLQKEIENFVFGFLIYMQRPAEARSLGRQREKGDQLPGLSQKINELYMHMLELTVLEQGALTSGKRRYFLPFIDIQPKTRKMEVKVVPLASSDSISSQQELSSGLSLMRDIDESLQNTLSFQPKAAPYIRELQKALFVFMNWQLRRRGTLDNSLGIDFSKVFKVLEVLEFNPGKSMRDLFYRDKYEKFKKLMEGKRLPFDAKKEDFQQWIKAQNVEPDRARVSQIFERDLEFALLTKAADTKREFMAQLELLAEASKETSQAETGSLRADFSGRIGNLAGFDRNK